MLAAKGLGGRKLPVLLAANKADHGAKAHSPDFVRRRLERELCVAPGPPPPSSWDNGIASKASCHGPKRRAMFCRAAWS